MANNKLIKRKACIKRALKIESKSTASEILNHSPRLFNFDMSKVTDALIKMIKDGDVRRYEARNGRSHCYGLVNKWTWRPNHPMINPPQMIMR